MEDIYIRMLLGHLFADYVLQPKVMALTKGKDMHPGLDGLLWSLAHGLIYTATMCLWLWTINPLVAVAIFLSHWPLDRYGFASWWLSVSGGRTLKDAAADQSEFKMFGVGFTCLMYAVVDNTFHLALMWAIVKYLVVPGVS